MRSAPPSHSCWAKTSGARPWKKACQQTRKAGNPRAVSWHEFNHEIHETHERVHGFRSSTSGEARPRAKHQSQWVGELLTSRPARTLAPPVDGVLRLVFQTQPRSISPRFFIRHPPEQSLRAANLTSAFCSDGVSTNRCSHLAQASRRANAASQRRAICGRVRPGNFPRLHATTVRWRVPPIRRPWTCRCQLQRNHGDGVADAAICARNRPVGCNESRQRRKMNLHQIPPKPAAGAMANRWVRATIRAGFAARHFRRRDGGIIRRRSPCRR